MQLMLTFRASFVSLNNLPTHSYYCSYDDLALFFPPIGSIANKPLLISLPETTFPPTPSPPLPYDLELAFEERDESNEGAGSLAVVDDEEGAAVGSVASLELDPAVEDEDTVCGGGGKASRAG
mmetsp:Transcript_24574/g.44170  ORF Transcript_24574/g.44170 Transcript_24574/m.44170 type:complete len:123 (+) Transcript_24574:140-508(+)